MTSPRAEPRAPTDATGARATDVLRGPALDLAALRPAAVARALSIEAAAAERGAHPALIAGDLCLDYAALARRAVDVALGAAPHPLVGAPTVEAVATIAAAAWRGVAIAPLHPRLDDERRAALIAGLPRASPRVLAIVHTSGTSGAPRRVALSRRAIVASATASGAALGWRADDRWLCALPLSGVGGLSVVTRCLIARATIVLPEGRRDAVGLAGLLARARITLVSLVPTQLDALVAVGRPAPPSLRRVLVGGAAAPPGLLARARALGYPVVTTYGMTETASLVALDGAPVAGAELRLADGRVHVRGPMLMDGYLPGGTGVSDGWLETGDLGRIVDGRLEIIGRADDTIVTGGEKVHPAEVEAALASLDGVRAACVFGVPDPRWGALVACALVTADDRPPPDLPRALAGLPSWQRPRRIALVPELAIGPTGKVDRRATAALAASRLTSR